MDIVKSESDVTAEVTEFERQGEGSEYGSIDGNRTTDPLLLSSDWTLNSSLGEYTLQLPEEGNQFDYDTFKTESKENNDMTFEEFNLDAFPEGEAVNYSPVTQETKSKSKSEEEISLIYDGKNSLLNPLMVMVPSSDESPAENSVFMGETEERAVVLEAIDQRLETSLNSPQLMPSSSSSVVPLPNSLPQRTSLPRLSCLPCNLFFNAQIDLDVHLMADHLYAFGCSVCLTFFANRDVLRKHEQTHWVNGFRTCPFCSAKFKLKNLLMTHLDTVHPNRSKMFGCNNPDCELLFGTMKELLRHKITDRHYLRPASSASSSGSSEVRWTWKCCGKEFKDHQNFKTHFDLNHGSSIVNINSETSTFVRPSSELENAVIMGAKAIPSSVQNSIPPNMSEEEIAENAAVLRQAPKCEICNLSFVTLEGLENHTKKKHSIKFLCLACNQEFLTKELLSSHTKLAHEQPQPPPQPKQKNTPRPRSHNHNRKPQPVNTALNINVTMSDADAATATVTSSPGGGTVHWSPSGQPSMTSPTKHVNSTPTSLERGEPQSKKIHLEEDDDLQLACMKLRSWFKVTPNPSEAEIRSYAEELNEGNNRPNLPLTEAFLRQWFGRARRGDFSIGGVLDTITDPNKVFIAAPEPVEPCPPNQSCVSINNTLSSGGSIHSQSPIVMASIPNNTSQASTSMINGCNLQMPNASRLVEQIPSSNPGVIRLVSHQPAGMPCIQRMPMNLPQSQSGVGPSISQLQVNLNPQSQTQFLPHPPPYRIPHPNINQQLSQQPQPLLTQTRVVNPQPPPYSGPGPRPGSIILTNPLLQRLLISHPNNTQLLQKLCNLANANIAQPQPQGMTMHTQNPRMATNTLAPQVTPDSRYLNQIRQMYSVVRTPPGPLVVRNQIPGQQQSNVIPPQTVRRYPPAAVRHPQQLQGSTPPRPVSPVVGSAPGPPGPRPVSPVVGSAPAPPGPRPVSPVVGSSPGPPGPIRNYLYEDYQSANQLCQTRGVFLHPEFEVKRLIAWFNRSPYPTDETFERYARVLNLMPFRQQQNMFKLNSQIIKHWFESVCLKLRRTSNDPNTAPAAPQSQVPLGEQSPQPQPQPLIPPQPQQEQQNSNNTFLLGQLHSSTLPPPQQQQASPSPVPQPIPVTNTTVSPGCAIEVENEQCSRVSSSQSPSTPAAAPIPPTRSTCKATINKYLEIPKLIKWAEITPNPTAEQVEAYTAELNKSVLRKEGTLLPRIAVANFFKKLNYHRMKNPELCETSTNQTVKDPDTVPQSSASSSPEIVATQGPSQLQSVDEANSEDSSKDSLNPQEPPNSDSNINSQYISEKNEKGNKPEPVLIDLEEEDDIQIVHEKIIKQRILPSQLFIASRDSDFLGPEYIGPSPTSFKLEELSPEEKEMDALIKKLVQEEASHFALRLILDKFSEFPHRITAYGTDYNTFRERLRTMIMKKSNSKLGKSSSANENVVTENPTPSTESSSVLPSVESE